jgi:hypothetical protein
MSGRYISDTQAAVMETGQERSCVARYALAATEIMWRRSPAQRSGAKGTGRSFTLSPAADYWRNGELAIHPTRSRCSRRGARSARCRARRIRTLPPFRQLILTVVFERMSANRGSGDDQNGFRGVVFWSQSDPKPTKVLAGRAYLVRCFCRRPPSRRALSSANERQRRPLGTAPRKRNLRPRCPPRNSIFYRWCRDREYRRPKLGDCAQ